ncbi:PREDICTED: CUB and zona pellucida-like domain-containing protein 1 [Poecilia mexicana]|uniref:CUB and zona pellucida-like domain-containing protein 1 n=1 Tax=Poecilia mexicana TaxID=48701 RepID=UPI00072E2E82|nr:PREDICTED: CUB and zona pellucida-like domain-containing protein 1 [Poecilia mexicana]
MPLGSCGTLVEEDDDSIIFTNVITSADKRKIVSRQHDVEISFSCSFPKRTNLTLGFRHKNPYAFNEKGFGAFTFQFEFFESQRFRKQVNASSYPVEVYLKQMIFMQIEATSSIPNTELFVESCRATPYDNPNSRISYTIIENGCVKDETVQIFPSSKSNFRFGMEAFEFIGAHEEVYIACSVLLCESGNPETRCSQGCIRSDSLNDRSRRDAPAQTSRHSISQGPLRLLRHSDTKVSHPDAGSGPGLYLGLNLVFAVCCLLVCGLVIYRSRRTRAKYQRLPAADSPVDSDRPVD